MSNTLESVVIGYIAGVVVGSLILVFIVGLILFRNGSITLPEWYVDLVAWTQEYRTANPTAFEIAFILGVISGLSGSGSAANNKRKNGN